MLKNPAYAPERLYKSAHRILDENALCAMSTITPQGQAHINTAYFAFDHDLNFCFLSYPSSIHARNIAANPNMGVAVADSRQVWGEHYRGLQLFGQAALSHNRATHRLYASRFPAYEEFIERAPSARDLRLYRFTPATIKILDEEEFGEIVYITAEVVPG